MTKITRTLTLAAGLVLSVAAYAQAPSGAPSGTTGLCKDGSYSSDATKKGACARHGGVKEWYATEEAKPAATPAAAAAPPKKEAATSAKEAAAPTKTSANTPAATPAAGGGSGKVWVNSASKVYHCEGTKWYGTTKKGEYMTEVQAKAAGNHADHGKACS